MMSSYVGARMNVFNESFLNETDQDANSVLTELDKGKYDYLFLTDSNWLMSF